MFEYELNSHNFDATNIKVQCFSRCKYECERNHSLVGSALNLSLKAGKCYKYSLIDENGDCSVDNFNVSNVEACKEWAYDEPESFVAEVR